MHALSDSIASLLFPLALGIALSCSAVACGGDDDPGDDQELADAALGEPDGGEIAGGCPEGTDVEELLATRCTGPACHSAEVAMAGLDLVSPGVAERLVGTPASTEKSCEGEVLVVAGDPDASLLLDKIEPSPSCGARMPYRQTPLEDEEIACVRDWIAGLSAAR